MPNNSVTLHRVFKANPEKVYRAFTEADAIASWLPPYGYVCTVHELNVKIDGTHKMSFRNFSTGQLQSFGGRYIDVKPNELLKYTDKFDEANLPGEMTTTIEFRKVSVGMEIKILQQGIPPMIPAESCYLGWQDSLEKLKALVEPQIGDAS